MAGEKNFENRLKRWLESMGIYPLGHPKDKIMVHPCGYYEKRWGGGRFQKSGLPDMLPETVSRIRRKLEK